MAATCPGYRSPRPSPLAGMSHHLSMWRPAYTRALPLDSNGDRGGNFKSGWHLLHGSAFIEDKIWAIVDALDLLEVQPPICAPAGLANRKAVEKFIWVWLSPLTFRETKNNAFSRRHLDTEQWVLKVEELSLTMVTITTVTTAAMLV
ncbi:hypothetical protein PHISCL_08108 [Aspergillus sclerotialis]|uniref:Uncharacterized protein n=1 Tax=Aspergillus sclerotialis TaxID=2070753 RepID=A0A3A2ZBC3_9EURO|nr:hypothetical protein PHISCL_08108 [Aspergillus sclerotialis]